MQDNLVHTVPATICESLGTHPSPLASLDLEVGVALITGWWFSGVSCQFSSCVTALLLNLCTSGFRMASLLCQIPD